MKKNAFKELLNKAENGDEEAMEKVIEAYQGWSDDFDVEENPAKEVYWKERLAHSGDVQIMFEVAQHYVEGYGGTRDLNKSTHWLKKVIEAGHDEAQNLLDELMAAIEYEKKAVAGDAQGQAEFARFLMQIESDLNYADSYKYATLAANQGNALGSYILGLCYEHGRGVKRNRTKANNAYLQGAISGDAPCQFNLGCALISEEKTKKEGVAWITKAADQEYQLALPAMGELYENGDLVEQNLERAIEWYQRSADLYDDDESLYRIAMIYTREIDGKMLSLEKAVEYFRKAADLGNIMALEQHQIWANVLQKGYDPMTLTKEEIFEMISDDDDDFDEDDENIDDDVEEGQIIPIPVITDANGNKHVDYFSLKLAGRESEYAALEAMLQESLKNETEE